MTALPGIDYLRTLSTVRLRIEEESILARLAGMPDSPERDRLIERAMWIDQHLAECGARTHDSGYHPI